MSIVYTTPESKTVEFVQGRLERHFIYTREREGRHIATGKKKRIDAILTPRTSLVNEGFPRLPVGLELKSFNLEDGNKKQIIELQKQAIDYRYTKFKLSNGESFLPLILVYPPTEYYLSCSNPDRKDFNDGFSYLNTRLMGQFWIGELFLGDDPVSFKIKLCGTDYFKMKPDGKGHRYQSNWGFERYEEEKRKIIDMNLDPDDYERRIMALAELLGI